MRTVEMEVDESLLEMLTEISEAVLKADNLSDALDRIVTKTTRELGASSGSISIPDETGEFLEVISSCNHDSDEIATINNESRLAVDEGVAGRAFVKEEVVQVPDIASSREFKPLKSGGRENYRSLLSVPLTVEDETLGVFNFTFEQKTKLHENDRYLLKIAGNQVAIAMRQGKLIEQLQKRNKKLLEMSRTDSLTKLPNHRRIHKVLCRELSRARENKDPLGVVMIDVDYFKRINDAYGHPAGDLVLRKLAALLEDSFGPEGRVGRYGGEEFLAVLPGFDLEQSLEQTEIIRDELDKSGVQAGDRQISVTVSAGITAAFPGDWPEDPSQLVKLADSALYRAKGDGRNCCKLENGDFSCGC